MHLAIYGEPNVGKTYTLYHTLHANKKNRVLLIRSLEELQQLQFQKYTDIIFDDISFELGRPELLIHLCDKDFDGGVRILRQYIRIDKNIRKWFTHNDRSAFEPLLASITQQKAIERRLKIVKVKNADDIREYISQHERHS